MVLTWRQRRKYMYLSVLTVCAVFLLLFIWQKFLHTTPTCFDGTKNGTERGVDCGGSCALVCQGESRAPTVLWVRAFPSATGAATAVAYIQNNMVGSGARDVQYSFQLFDQNNVLIVEKRGVVDLPPNQIIPIIETSINVGNRSVARAQFAFSQSPMWAKVPAATITPLRLSGQALAADGTRLSATLHNDSVDNVPRTTLVAVLFDAEGVARAASKSLVRSLSAKSSEEVVFTWGPSTPNVARAEITILPEF